MSALNQVLLKAAAMGDLKAATKCLEGGADVNCISSRDTIGMEAVLYGYQYIDDMDKEIVDSHFRNWTPLHLAARGGHTDMAALLISKGAHINIKDRHLQTPLHWVAERGYTDLAALGGRKGLILACMDRTPIYWAAKGGHTDLVALLLSKGVDINCQDGLDRCTPLHLAAREGHTDLAALLISTGADMNIKNIERKTSLDLANGETQILLQMIKSSVHVDKANEAVKHCKSLEEAMQYIQLGPTTSAIPTPTLKSHEEGAPKTDLQDVMFPGIIDAVEFKSLLKKGTYESFGNRIYLAGACNVGKTTLASLLIGDKTPFRWRSTDGLKIFFGRNGIDLKKRKMIPLNKAILNHWVDSILTYCGEEDDDTLPVILFVATHRDKLTEVQQLKMTTEFKTGLKDMFEKHDQNERIKYNDIFFINGTDKNDQEVERLKAAYVDIAFRQKSWGQRMPMAWVPLELQMSKMRANNISIISKEELIEINKDNDDLALTNSQLDQFLRVQHSLGKIMYLEGKGLSKYIIVQPTTMVDILRSFITDEMFWPSDRNLKVILRGITETGKIKKVDLFRLWSQDEFNKHMPKKEFKEFVAQVLVYLDLLVNPKRSNIKDTANDFYIVPCMAKRKTNANFGANLDKDRTICLSYKLLKSSIPSALSYKLIGAALNVWPLKETDKGVCLYHKAAILCIDKANELHILVRDDRVIVYLLHEQSKHFISPDVASCAQECLTLTLMSAFEFYHNSFGKFVSKLKIACLFEMEIGEICDKKICYIPISQAQNNRLWTCKFGKEHTTKYPLYWTYEKKQDLCKPECKGLEEECLEFMPTEKHLVRLANQIGVKQFEMFIINLGLPRKNWEQIEYKHQRGDVTGMKFDALCEVEKVMKRPLFNDLHNALRNSDCNSHILCQVFREERSILDIDNLKLQDIPDNDTLHGLSRNIGNCAIHLGVELEVNVHDIEETIVRYNKDMFEQNYDILMKWKKVPGGNKTIRALMNALWIVDRRGCTFLKEKYNIEY